MCPVCTVCTSRMRLARAVLVLRVPASASCVRCAHCLCNICVSCVHLVCGLRAPRMVCARSSRVSCLPCAHVVHFSRVLLTPYEPAVHPRLELALFLWAVCDGAHVMSGRVCWCMDLACSERTSRAPCVPAHRFSRVYCVSVCVPSVRLMHTSCAPRTHGVHTRRRAHPVWNSEWISYAPFVHHGRIQGVPCMRLAGIADWSRAS